MWLKYFSIDLQSKGSIHSSSKTHVRNRIFKFTLIHASVIYQIPEFSNFIEFLFHLEKNSMFLMLFCQCACFWDKCLPVLFLTSGQWVVLGPQGRTERWSGQGTTGQKRWISAGSAAESRRYESEESELIVMKAKAKWALQLTPTLRDILTSRTVI